MEDDNFVVAGQIGILDLTNCTPEHFEQFKPDIIKKMTYLCQDSSPIRPKGFHYVNTPDGFEFFFNMFKSFMSDAYKKLVGFFVQITYQKGCKNKNAYLFLAFCSWFRFGIIISSYTKTTVTHRIWRYLIITNKFVMKLFPLKLIYMVL